MWPGAEAVRAAVVHVAAAAAAAATHAARRAQGVRRPWTQPTPRDGPRMIRLRVRPTTEDAVVSGRRWRSRQVEARVTYSGCAHARDAVRPRPTAGDGGCPAKIAASARESGRVAAGAALRRRGRRPYLPAVRPARRRQLLQLLLLPYGRRPARRAGHRVHRKTLRDITRCQGYAQTTGAECGGIAIT